MALGTWEPIREISGRSRAVRIPGRFHVNKVLIFFFSSRRRHTRYIGDWSSDVCSSDLIVSAIRWRKLKTLDLLIDAGADLSFQDPNGRDAMFLARRKKLPAPVLARLEALQIGRASCRERV